MKKSYLFFLSLFLVLISSCNDENFDLSTDKLDQEIQPTTRAIDRKWDALGFSYDVSYDYLDTKAVRLPVFDVEALEKAHPNRVIPHNPGASNILIYAGHDATSYLQSIKVGNNYDGSFGAAYDTTAKGSTFGLSFDIDNKDNKSFFNQYKTSTKYSFARADVRQSIGRYEINADLSILRQFITTSFIEDLYLKTADEFVSLYGTNVLTDIEIGGIYSSLYRSAITTTDNEQKKTDIVTSGVKVKVLFFSIGSSNVNTTETEIKESTENKEDEVNISYIGGNNNGLSYTVSAGDIQSKSFNLSTWSGSINKGNCAIIDINWKSAYPIYEFISDPVKKEEIKEAVKRYLAKKVFYSLQLNPLFVYYDKTLQEHITTSELGLEKQNPRYINMGVAGYAMKDSYPGLNQPLYLWKNIKTGYHVTTVDPNMNRYDSNLKIDKIVGYTYYEGNQPKEGLALYEYVTTKAGIANGEHYTATNTNLLYNLPNLYTPYSWNLGYIYK